MALLSAITGTPLTDLRSNANYRAIQYLCLVPNDVVVRFQPLVAPTTAVYAEITVGTVGTGSMSNIREGQAVIYSTTTDHQATEVFRTRVRKVSGTATLFVGENSQVLTTSMYVTVIDTYELREKLRRSATQMDWEITFRKLLPIETALPSAVVISNGGTSYTPTAVPKAMDASATATFIHFWESSNSNDSIANATTASPTITLQAAAFRWLRYTFTDSGGRVNYRVIPCWTIPKNYSSQIATGFVSANGDMADISYDAELGWSATIPAFDGIENVLNKTLCVIASDEWYNNSRQSIRTNINMVGWLQNENTRTSGSDTIGRDTETSFTIEGIGHQLARLNVSSATVIQTRGTPTAWDTIQNPTPARMLTYHLTENTTLFNLCSMSIPADDTDFVGDDYTISNGKALDDIRAMTEVINAELQFDTNGRLDLCRNLVYLDSTARTAAATVVQFAQGDFTNHSIDYDYSAQTSTLNMTGGVYNSSLDSYVLYEADAPSVARLGEGDPQKISNQVLTTDSTATEALAEIAERASNFFAAHNPTWTLRCTLNDEWWFLVPDVGAWFTFPLAETDTARGKVFSSADRWQLLQISHSTNNITGRRQVDATFRLETQSTGAMVRAAMIQNDTAADIIYYPAVLAPFTGENLDYTDGNWYDSEDVAPPSDPTPVSAECQLLGLRPKSGLTIASASVATTYVSVTVRGSGRLNTGGASILSVNSRTDSVAGGATGIMVTNGQLISFSASGTWRWSNGVPYHDADGEPGYTATLTTLPSAQVGALVGKVGAGGSWFLIGVSNSISMPATGELYLVMNDRDGVNRFDNSGSQTVTIGAGIPAIGDSLYFSEDEGETWEAYNTGNGLYIEGVQQVPPPFNPSHEYFFPAILVTGLATVEFEFQYADYPLSGMENWGIQVVVCEVDDPV